MPSSPPQYVQVSIETSRIINITWSPPIVDSQNGEIISYQVLVDQDELEDPITVDLDGKALKTTVNNLLPFKLYSIRVAAGTRVGLGPYSTLELVEMPEDGKLKSVFVI